MIFFMIGGGISCALYRIFNAILTCLEQNKGCIPCALYSNFHAILTCLKQNKGVYTMCSI